MALDLIAELERLLEQFEADRVNYALCGALALAVHGYPRATADIDVLVPLGDLEGALRAARRAGFDTPARKMTFGIRTGAPREVQRVAKPDPETGTALALDLVVVNPELAPVWDGREVVASGKRQLSVVSRRGLVIMKRLSATSQDLADLEKLEGTLDEEHN